MPIVWAASIVTRARKEGRIRDDFAMKTMIDELNSFRGQCGVLLGYDTISVPLVYTQVVTLAVYTYFMSTLMAHQWIVNKDKANVDYYFPLFTALQFFFYVGWLKVAETLINPFGDDDDDFEVNWMVDRNLQVSYLIVDEMHHEHPKLVRDQYWENGLPQELPYTIAAEPFRERHPLPSTANIVVSQTDACFSNLKSNFTPSIDDGIHFFAKSNSNLRSRLGGSHSSVGSVTAPDSSAASRWNSLSRVASTASVLKRLFPSRDDVRSRQGSREDVRAPTSPHSPAVLRHVPPLNFRNITDEIIEEVDELQATLHAPKDKDPRTPVMDVFKNPPMNDSLPSPSSQSAVPENSRAGGSQRNSENPSTVDDDFSRLKYTREKERQERLMYALMRSVSNKSEEEDSDNNAAIIKEREEGREEPSVAFHKV